MKKLTELVFGAVLLIPIISGCSGHVYVQTYGPAETPYYARWEHETHRDHVEWEVRSDSEHKAYWNWRKRHHD